MLVALRGLFGLSANPVLIALAVRFAGKAPTVGSSPAVSAFNVGTAAGSWIGGAPRSALRARRHRPDGHLDGIPAGYVDMDQPRSLKAMIKN